MLRANCDTRNIMPSPMVIGVCVKACDGVGEEADGRRWRATDGDGRDGRWESEACRACAAFLGPRGIKSGINMVLNHEGQTAPI